MLVSLTFPATVVAGVVRTFSHAKYDTLGDMAVAVKVNEAPGAVVWLA